jgi:energy-converting hydrogenase Eha subunit F
MRVSASQWKADYNEFQEDLSKIASYAEDIHHNTPAYTQWAFQVDQVSNIQALGQILYTYYCAYFILASIILLVAMIGAIVLTMHKSITVKRQEVFEQNTREFAKTVQKIRDSM